MKKILSAIAGLALLLSPSSIFSQCTTTNATSCQCPPGGGTNCDLLPDITLSKDAITNGGYVEYPQVNAGTSQASQGADDGRLRLTGATPNIGYGPIETRGVSKWVCGTDTFTVYPGAASCADGSDPKQVVAQRIYHKNGNTMSYTDHEAGTMTYHPTHGHQHIDAWGTYTLRIENLNDPNPLNWSIVGTGSKLAFCLLDLSNCNSTNNYCKDSLGNLLNSTNLPNYGLGGGSYSCSNTVQGISAGYVDIYSLSLDGMWINIPPDVCNGNYWIVVQADPNNNFREYREWNNVIAVPVTLTHQTAPGTGVAVISADRPGTILPSDTVTLTANAGSAYLWSTGATTQTIKVYASGSYTVTVTNPCGTATSAPFSVTVLSTPASPAGTNDNRCGPGTVTLNASGSDTLKWFSLASGGIPINSGTSYLTPSLSATTTYYVESDVTTAGATGNTTPSANTITGTGGYYTGTNNQYEVFTVYSRLTLQSVQVYANTAGARTIKLLDKNASTLRQVTATLPAGSSRVTLNWTIDPDDGYRLQIDGGPNVYYNTSTANIGYPFTIPGKISITNSSGGHTNYYYFYDWQFKSPDLVAKSARVPVTATINPIPTVSFSGLASSYPVTAGPITMTGSGTPTGGTFNFSGPGVSGNTFSPAVAGIGGPYTVTFTYVTTAGCSNSTSQQVTVTAATNNCLRPFNLSATNISNVSAQVNWDVSVTADTFRIRYSINGTTNYLYKDVSGSGGIHSTLLTGLLPATTYQYQVSSVCRGVSSGYSLASTFITTSVPASCIIPFSLGATNILNNSAQVSWSNLVVSDTFRIRYAVSGTTNYLYKDVAGSAGSSTSLTRLMAGTAYQFQVSSICHGVSSGYSTSYIFTTSSIPVRCAVPYGLNSSNITTAAALIGWTNLVSADTFRVRYYVTGTTGYFYKNISGSAGNSTTLSGLIPATSYQFQVSAICAGVSSGYSSAAAFTTLAGLVHCGIPSGLTSSSITNTSARVNWANTVSADTFRIRYAIAGGQSYSYVNVNAAAGNFAALSNLLPATTYQFQVSAVCSGQGSGYSSLASFTTLAAPVACITPYNLSTTSITNNSAICNWTPYVTADSFMVRYSANGSTNYLWKKISGAGSIHSMQLTGLLSNTNYQWQARTLCTGIPSTAYSVTAGFTTGLIRLANPAAIVSDLFEVFPNPADEFVSVRFDGTFKEQGSIHLSDLSGRILLSEKITILEGENLIQLNTSGLGAGVYVIRLESAGMTGQSRVVIQ